MFKSGYITVVGKPNAGKSTLVNKLVGFKVAITTPTSLSQYTYYYWRVDVSDGKATTEGDIQTQVRTYCTGTVLQCSR